MLVTELGMVMLVSPVQSENADVPMLVIVLGILNSISHVQPLNAYAPMLVTELGITVFLHANIILLVAVSITALQLSRESYLGFPVSTIIDVRPLQSENALPAMFLTELGMVMLVSPVQPENAHFSILVTELGMVMFVSPVQP